MKERLTEVRNQEQAAEVRRRIMHLVNEAELSEAVTEEMDSSRIWSEIVLPEIETYTNWFADSVWDPELINADNFERVQLTARHLHGIRERVQSLKDQKGELLEQARELQIMLEEAEKSGLIPKGAMNDA
jgi:hypothetical protein